MPHRKTEAGAHGDAPPPPVLKNTRSPATDMPEPGEVVRIGIVQPILPVRVLIAPYTPCFTPSNVTRGGRVPSALIPVLLGLYLECE